MTQTTHTQSSQKQVLNLETWWTVAAEVFCNRKRSTIFSSYKTPSSGHGSVVPTISLSPCVLHFLVLHDSRHEQQAAPAPWSPWQDCLPFPACQELDERYARLALDHIKVTEFRRKKQTDFFPFSIASGFLHLLERMALNRSKRYAIFFMSQFSANNFTFFKKKIISFILGFSVQYLWTAFSLILKLLQF